MESLGDPSLVRNDLPDRLRRAVHDAHRPGADGPDSAPSSCRVPRSVGCCFHDPSAADVRQSCSRWRPAQGPFAFVTSHCSARVCRDDVARCRAENRLAARHGFDNSCSLASLLGRTGSAGSPRCDRDPNSGTTTSAGALEWGGRQQPAPTLARHALSCGVVAVDDRVMASSEQMSFPRYALRGFVLLTTIGSAVACRGRMESRLARRELWIRLEPAGSGHPHRPGCGRERPTARRRSLSPSARTCRRQRAD